MHFWPLELIDDPAARFTQFDAELEPLIDEFIAVNQRNLKAYRQTLADVPGLRLIEYNERERNNYQYVVVEVNEGEVGLSRDELNRVLHAENILSRRYFSPGCHRMEPYRSYFPHAKLMLTETERVLRRVLVLPTGSAVDRSAVASICQVIRAAFRHADSLRHRLVNYPMR